MQLQRTNAIHSKAIGERWKRSAAGASNPSPQTPEEELIYHNVMKQHRFGQKITNVHYKHDTILRYSRWCIVNIDCLTMVDNMSAVGNDSRPRVVPQLIKWLSTIMRE